MKINNVAKLLVVSATAAFASNASAISEVEVNSHISGAQVVTSNGSTIDISAMMGFPDKPTVEDLDFFQIKVKAGDILTLDIDNGYKGNAPLNTLIAVFGAGPEYPILRMNDDAPVDSGSISPMDARIDDFVVPHDGVYTVGVSTAPRFFFNGGAAASGFTSDPMAMDPNMAFMDPAMTSGNVISDYKLIISGVSSSVGPKKINIEVKPGSDGLTTLNPRSKGKIPVAILGSLNFSAVNVDTSSLTFGSTGYEQSLSKCAKSGEDVNGDGYYDLVCHFENQKAGFKYGSLEGVLKGKTRSGEKFEGRALLKVFPTK